MEKRTFIFVLASMLMSFSMAGQENANLLFYDLQKAKQSGVVFNDVSKCQYKT